jgi:hypothetical protein
MVVNKYIFKLIILSFESIKEVYIAGIQLYIKQVNSLFIECI